MYLYLSLPYFTIIYCYKVSICENVWILGKIFHSLLHKIHWNSNNYVFSLFQKLSQIVTLYSGIPNKHGALIINKHVLLNWYSSMKKKWESFEWFWHKKLTWKSIDSSKKHIKCILYILVCMWQSLRTDLKSSTSPFLTDLQ